MTPFMASEVPSPNAEPPDDLTVASTVARSSASSIAETVIAPEVTVASAFRIYASTSARRSLETTSPPKASLSESVRFRPCGTAEFIVCGRHKSKFE